MNIIVGQKKTHDKLHLLRRITLPLLLMSHYDVDTICRYFGHCNIGGCQSLFVGVGDIGFISFDAIVVQLLLMRSFERCF